MTAHPDDCDLMANLMIIDTILAGSCGNDRRADSGLSSAMWSAIASNIPRRVSPLKREDGACG